MRSGINRILVLGGLPSSQALDTLMIGKSTPEMPERVLKLELLKQ